ncbi:MAG: MoaD/ThiS family protein [Actinomycetota bacterium]|nr:MoaD/ThiS family protein [Actinomycetota bacterium]
MIKLLFFANLRETVGARSIEVPADDLNIIVDQLIHKFGPRFQEQLKQCRIWIDGNEALEGQSITDGSEVAFLPPVSGGCTSRSICIFGSRPSNFQE